MDSPAWKARFSAELERGRAARAAGNEGQARVCARRAAGIAIGEFLLHQGLPLPGPSAVIRLEQLLGLPEVSPQASEIAKHLLTRVDEDFSLPIPVDLLAEAEQLVKELGISS
jgi:hypothetical protein